MASALPLPPAALWLLLGAALGGLQRDSYVRGLMQVKMHLTLMQHCSPCSLSRLSFPRL